MCQRALWAILTIATEINAVIVLSQIRTSVVSEFLLWEQRQNLLRLSPHQQPHFLMQPPPSLKMPESCSNLLLQIIICTFVSYPLPKAPNDVTDTAASGDGDHKKKNPAISKLRMRINASAFVFVYFKYYQ